MDRRAVNAIALSFVLAAVFSGTAEAKKAPPDPSLTQQQVSILERARRNAKSNPTKSNQQIQQVLQGATDVHQCLAIADYSESEGFSLLEARKKSLEKAIELSKGKDDLILVVVKGRKLQCFDATSEAIKALLNTCTSPDDLYDLARKTQEISCNDITRLALEKILAQTKNATDALALAKQSRILGLDDFSRRVIKDVEDDCQTTPECMEILPAIEQFKYPDATRYILKKALEKSTSVEEYLNVNKAAIRLGQPDIANVSSFKGRKLIYEQQANEQKARDAQAAQDQRSQGMNHANTGAGF